LGKYINTKQKLPGSTIWSVQQRLGLEYESWAEPSTPESHDVVRFAGVDLAEY